MIEAIHKLTEDLRGKVRLMIGRCILSAVTDTGAIQTVQAQLLADEVHDGMERVQQYGFTSVPLPGAEGVVVFPGGNRDHGLIIATEHRQYRLTGLAGGEMALYTWKNQEAPGHRIVFKNDGSIEVSAKNITVKALETVRIEGDVVHLHAASRFEFDCNGHGQKWLPTRIDTWQIGETAGTAHAISPPEMI